MQRKALWFRVESFCGVAIILSSSLTGLCGDIGVTLEWDPNPEADIAGYIAYVGTQRGRYDQMIDAGANTFVRVSPLDPGVTYYFAVTAYGSDHLESSFSEEIAYTVRIDGTNAMVKPIAIAFTNAASPVSVSFNVKPGRRYLLQATTDLRAWETLETFFFETSGGVVWEDSAVLAHPFRFYRVVAVMP